MKKVLFILSLIFTVILVTGCFFESVTSIRVVSGIKASWDLDEEIDLHDIVIEVVVDGKVTKTVYGDTEGVSVVGLSTASTGQKTAVVTYEGVSVSVSYLVVGEDSTASSILKLAELLNDGKEIITLTAGTYDFYLNDNQLTISKSVVIRAVPGTKVILKNVLVNFNQTQPGVVEFRNVEFAKGQEFEPLAKPTDTPAKRYNLNIKTSRAIVEASPITDFDRVVLNNVTLSASGETFGVKLDGKTNFEMYNSKWVTPTQDDYFNYMMYTNAAKMPNNLLILENNEFKCNFWYGLGQISQAIIRGNLFEGTIPVDSHLRDSAYAPIYNVNKNPVIFHASLRAPAADGTTHANDGFLSLVIENNTFKNVENLFRVYNTDYNTTKPIEQDLIFKDNIVLNVNYLVNYSSNAYTKDVVTVVQDRLKQGSQFLNESRAVMEKNTVIVGTYGPEALLKVGSDMIYRGFTYQEKDTSDAANRYFYIGSISGNKTLARFVGEEVVYYTITLSYSADGLDTRDIVRITDQDIINKLEGYRTAGHFTITEFE